MYSQNILKKSFLLIIRILNKKFSFEILNMTESSFTYIQSQMISLFDALLKPYNFCTKFFSLMYYFSNILFFEYFTSLGFFITMYFEHIFSSRIVSEIKVNF